MASTEAESQTGEPTAVVVGAAGGIGERVVDALLGAGYRVAAVDRDLVNLGEQAGLRFRQIDLLADEADDELAQLAADLDREGATVSSLIYCAGIGGWRPVEQVPPSEWDAIVGTNLRGAYLACRHLVPLLRRRPGGTVVLLASDSADFGFPLRTAYCASKHGLAGFAEALREEARPHGVRVSLLKMSRVDTGFNGGTAGSRPEALRPDSVADAVRFVVAQPTAVEVRELALTSVHSSYGPLAAAPVREREETRA